jgi:hypothetical protein
VVIMAVSYGPELLYALHALSRGRSAGQVARTLQERYGVDVVDAIEITRTARQAIDVADGFRGWRQTRDVRRWIEAAPSVDGLGEFIRMEAAINVFGRGTGYAAGYRRRVIDVEGQYLTDLDFPIRVAQELLPRPRLQTLAQAQRARQGSPPITITEIHELEERVRLIVMVWGTRQITPEELDVIYDYLEWFETRPIWILRGR